MRENDSLGFFSTENDVFIAIHVLFCLLVAFVVLWITNVCDYLSSGITNDSLDASIDTFRSTALNILKKFGVPSEGLDLKIESRGVPPLGGGAVFLTVPTVNTLTVSFTESKRRYCN